MRVAETPLNIFIGDGASRGALVQRCYLGDGMDDAAGAANDDKRMETLRAILESQRDTFDQMRLACRLRPSWDWSLGRGHEAAKRLGAGSIMAHERFLNAQYLYGTVGHEHHIAIGANSQPEL